MSFENDFFELLKEDLKNQNKSDAEIQSAISFVKNDEEFREVREIQEKENEAYFADTEQELAKDAAELHTNILEQQQLSEAIENYAVRNEHLDQQYFAPAKIPAPTPAPEIAPTPTSGVTPGLGSGSSGTDSSTPSSGVAEPE